MVGNSCLLSVGAPDSPVPNRTVNSHDFFPFLAKLTVATTTPFSTLDSPVAHRTVWCALVTVGEVHASPVDCALITMPIVGSDVVGAPDSPVNFSRSILGNS